MKSSSATVMGLASHSATSASCPKFLICSLRIAEISAGRISMATSLHGERDFKNGIGNSQWSLWAGWVSLDIAPSGTDLDEQQWSRARGSWQAQSRNSGRRNF